MMRIHDLHFPMMSELKNRASVSPVRPRGRFGETGGPGCPASFGKHQRCLCHRSQHGVAAGIKGKGSVWGMAYDQTVGGDSGGEVRPSLERSLES